MVFVMEKWLYMENVHGVLGTGPDGSVDTLLVIPGVLVSRGLLLGFGNVYYCGCE